jgi:membrane carboxypeptidase/penicillin-binding protein
VDNLSQSGRPQGGSTITQQVVKNLLLGDEVTYDRKMREMVLASRVESKFTKSQILELYLNSIFLGRGSWGVEMAARSYFGKGASALTLSEGALLAALAKGPSYFNPDTHPDRAKERLAYVVRRMQEDGAIGADDARVTSSLPATVRYQPPQNNGTYFTDYVARAMRSESDLSAFRAGSTTVHSTLDPTLQRAAEIALEEGLARYEQSERRVDFRGPEANLGSEVERLSAGPQQSTPAWQRALDNVRLPLSGVHWDPAVVVEKGERRGDGSVRVGLADGTVVSLSGPAAILRKVELYDVVRVQLGERNRKGRAARAQLRVPPTVQGAAVAIENKTGRILAMVGGFSYGASQLNRVTQSARQPGSTLKPLTYLAALQKGLQPNTLVRDEEITFPPINRGKGEEGYWTPKNYDGDSRGVITLREALENSRNQATASLLRGIENKPEQSLDRICSLALELQIYKDCVHYYPFVLGAEPVRPIDLAAFFATIANEGTRPAPYAIESIDQNGREVYRRQPSLVPTASADPASFYQLKTMLQGVVQHGTAHAMSDLAPYVAGKTGTSEDENDAWFVGFTNDVTVAVWVGYDNGAGSRRTLGSGSTGAHVALPIFEPIVEASWADGRPKEPLAPPSAQARRLLAVAQAERPRRERSRDTVLVEYFRKDSKGEPIDARFALLSGRSETRTASSRSETRTARAHSRSSERRLSRSGEAIETTGRGFFSAPGSPFGQPGQWTLGRSSQPQPQWRDNRSYSNGGFFGFPFGRN